MTPPTSSRIDRIALALLAGFAMVLLIGPIARLPFWTELPNEGWNAIHAMHAFTRALYPAPPAWIINNYPPLWFYLIGALGALTGDPILAGRGVALAAFVATTGAIYALLRQLSASVAASLAGALSFAIVVAGLLGLYVGLFEPQMLAHAVVTSSVALLIGADTRRRAVFAALGVVVAILIKPIVIALPLAATAWLFVYRRRLFWSWVVTGASAALASVAVFTLAYGAPFVANITFPRMFTLHRLGTNLALISKPIVPLVAFAWLATRRDAFRNPAIAFAGFAIVAAVVEMLIFGGALGVSINIVFDLVIAAAIGFGLAFDRLGAFADSVRWRVALLAAAILRVALGMPNPLQDVSTAGRDELRAQQAAVREVVARIGPLKGPVACEALAACAFAGHASEADLWKLRFETTLGPFMDTRALLDGIAQGRFSAVVTYGNYRAKSDDRNLPGLYDALGAWYEPPIKAGTAFLIFIRKPR